MHLVSFSGTTEALALIGPQLVDFVPLEQLTSYLNQPLTSAFPLSPYIFERLKALCVGTSLSVLEGRIAFLENSPHPFPPDFCPMDWLVRDFTHEVAGNSEDSLHAVITPPVQYMLEYFMGVMGGGVNVEFSRNKSEKDKRLKTTTGTKRPDWLMHVNNLLVFRGEEKDFGNSDGDDPAVELTEKMVAWNPLFFGDIPYVLGYTLVGVMFQLYALHPGTRLENDEVPVISTRIGNELHLGRVVDRITILQYIIKLVCVIQALASAIPPNAPKLFAKYQSLRPYSGEFSSVFFDPCFVRKELANLNVPAAGCQRFNFDGLQELYSLVTNGRVVSTIKCLPGYPVVETRSDGVPYMTLHLRPLGKNQEPNSPAELKSCLLSVLMALESMHVNLFCHRDVRWPNILQLANKTWIIIDLEFALKMDTSREVAWPFWIDSYQSNARWPHRVNSNQRWRAAEDVWMVGQLLDDMKPILGLDKGWLGNAIKQCANCAQARREIERFLV